jgi:putative tricarboxylic transport membrane protein
MDLIANLGIGFGAVFTTQNLLFCLMGCLLGTLIGVLPGIGPLVTIALLLPATFSLPPLSALIMLAGIYYGAQYGGSTTSILMNLPGESSSVVTCIDGYQMARQGRAGAALSIAALGSFFAGCVGTVLIAVLAPMLSLVAQKFSAPEYFALMTFGLIAAVVLAHGSVIKAISMIFLGLLFGLVGTDVNTGQQRFTFGIPELSDGIGFVPIGMGLFAIGEVIANLHNPQQRTFLTSKITGLLITKQDFKAAWKAVVRGTGVGSLLGILPGGGSILGSFAAYMVEKKLAKDPSRFGKGAIEGVAGPESANNAAAQTSFIPLLTLGIPANPVMALMMGAMMIQGIAPGAAVMAERPQLFWGMIVSMWIGNLMLVVINLPLIGMWVSLLRIPYRLMYPGILIFCCIGVYSLNNSAFEVLMTVGFGLLGFVFIRLGCEPAPLILAFVLGPLMEENLRRAMLLSRGDPTIFVQRPISAVILAMAAALLVVLVLPAVRKKREQAFQGEA